MEVDMYNPNHNLSCFLEELLTSKTFDEAFDAYDKQVQKLGYEGAIYAFIPKLYLKAGSPITPIFKISESRDPAFIKHYIDAGFEKDDFTIQRIVYQEESKIIDWWEEEAKGTLNPAQKNVIATAKEIYGIHNGISVPIMNSQKGIATVSVTSSEKGDAYQTLITENFQIFQDCTIIFHQHITSNPQLQHYFLSPLLSKLTSTEKRLLPFLASGLPVKAINLTPKVTPKYADKLIYSIRRKFGNINKAQLIYHIGLLQLNDSL